VVTDDQFARIFHRLPKSTRRHVGQVVAHGVPAGDPLSAWLAARLAARQLDLPDRWREYWWATALPLLGGAFVFGPTWFVAMALLDSGLVIAHLAGRSCLRRALAANRPLAVVPWDPDYWRI
jgi:hypothetical protein